MRVELHYDRMGGRLVGIGNTEIRYDMMGGRPRWLGDTELQNWQHRNSVRHDGWSSPTGG